MQLNEYTNATSASLVDFRLTVIERTKCLACSLKTLSFLSVVSQEVIFCISCSQIVPM